MSILHEKFPDTRLDREIHLFSGDSVVHKLRVVRLKGRSD